MKETKMKQALLLSSSMAQGSNYLEWCKVLISDFFKNCKNILFIPYAAVSMSFEEYENKVIKALDTNHQKLKSIHFFDNKKQAVKLCDGIMTGGGNTFVLKKRLEDEDMFNLIKTRVHNEEIPYAGWSAGANLGSLSIRTTNDMPIVQPESFEGLALADFQINPHYINEKYKNHHGETRDERLKEFSIMNPQDLCAAIPEGSGISIKDEKAFFFGKEKGKLFFNGDFYRFIKNKEQIKI